MAWLRRASNSSRRSAISAASWRGATTSAGVALPAATRARTAASNRRFSSASAFRRASCCSTVWRLIQASAASRNTVSRATSASTSATATWPRAAATRAWRLARLGTSCISPMRRMVMNHEVAAEAVRVGPVQLSKPKTSFGSGNAPEALSAARAAASFSSAALSCGARDCARRNASSKDRAWLTGTRARNESRNSQCLAEKNRGSINMRAPPVYHLEAPPPLGFSQRPRCRVMRLVFQLPIQLLTRPTSTCTKLETG
jgi:hypothetical protein